MLATKKLSRRRMRLGSEFYVIAEKEGKRGRKEIRAQGRTDLEPTSGNG